MKDMKLIMEGWRQYGESDKQYDEALNYILENHYNGVLTEGIKDDILSGMKSLAARFGKTAVTAAMVASITLGAIGPSIAQVVDDATPTDIPAAAQVMDVDAAKDILNNSEAGKAVKDILGKLFNKNAVDADTPAPAAALEGFSQNAETGDYEFRVEADGYSDYGAKLEAKAGLLKSLAEKGLGDSETNQDGNTTTTQGSISGVTFEYDRANGQLVGKWNPDTSDAIQKIKGGEQPNQATDSSNNSRVRTSTSDF